MASYKMYQPTNIGQSVARTFSTWTAFSTIVAVGACSAPQAEGSNDQEAQAATETNSGLTLEIGGESTVLNRVTGGEIQNGEQSPSTYGEFRVKKHIGNVKYNDFALRLSLPLAPSAAAWISDFFAGRAPRRSGSVVECTKNGFSTCTTREFNDALITEVGIPACDGSSKEPAYLTLKFAPEYTRKVRPSGKSSTASAASAKAFVPSNFQFAIAGLDTSKVNKVDALTVKQTAVTDDIGDGREYTKEPGKLEFPSLKITMSEEYAPDFSSWYKDFVIDGNNDAQKHKTGSLVFLTPTRSSVLAINFSGLGIFKISAAARKNNEDAIASATVEMYAETITAKFDGDSDAGAR